MTILLRSLLKAASPTPFKVTLGESQSFRDIMLT